MLQNQYMAGWVPGFTSALEMELNQENATPFITCQLATVDSQGFPHVRTLVYRGFLFDDKSNNIISLTTDRRMSKYQEILNNDKVEAVFYFPTSRKQFRFRGVARIIDKEHKPRVDISSISPRHIIENSRSASASDSDSDSDSDDDNSSIEEETVLEFQNSAIPPISRPIHHHLISPSLSTTLQQYKSANNLSYTNLHDLTSVEFTPPSEEEWNQEILRQWSNLSKKLKSSFRKPMPKTKIDNEKQKLIDSISRGVDGKKEETGMDNFAIIALFTDYVDLYEMEKDRRYIYEKDSYQMWKENEVCP